MIEEKKVIRLKPLSNVVFTHIFRNLKNSETAMLEFLNALLEYVGEEPIDEIIEIRSEYNLLGETAYQKGSRIDVIAKTRSGRIFVIEVQIEKDFMNNRGLIYGGREMWDDFHPGMPYNKIPAVRMICLEDFYMRDDHSNIVEPVSLVYENAPDEIATDKFKIYHIQLPAFKKRFKSLDSVKDNLFLTWLYVLTEGYKKEEEMELIAGLTDGLANFAREYGYAINDPDLIYHYRAIEDGRRDAISQLAFAREEGEKLGEESGILKVARNLKNSGLSNEDIAANTGLTLEKIEAL